MDLQNTLAPKNGTLSHCKTCGFHGLTYRGLCRVHAAEAAKG